MDNGPGWMADPDHEAQERYWDGSGWTDQVRPAIAAGRLHLPEHVPELQRALAAATADIDAVEDRLSILFDRSEGKIPPADPRPAPPEVPSDAELETQADAELVAEHEAEAVVDDADAGGAAEATEATEATEANDEARPEDQRTDNGGGIEASGGAEDDEDGAFAELDAALASEKPSRFRFRSRKRS
jgi:hypothetical protein